MSKVFYEIGTWKLAFERQNLSFKTPAFGIYEIDPRFKIAFLLFTNFANWLK